MNPGQVGFYRTCYDPELLKHLVSAIDHQTLPPLDRFGLLDDLMALVKAGHSSSVDVLKLMESLAVKEDHYTVWNRVCSVLTKFSHLLEYTDHYDSIKSNPHSFYSTSYKCYWENEIFIYFSQVLAGGWLAT